jgi:hypothetical protein
MDILKMFVSFIECNKDLSMSYDPITGCLTTVCDDPDVFDLLSVGEELMALGIEGIQPHIQPRDIACSCQTNTHLEPLKGTPCQICGRELL